MLTTLKQSFTVIWNQRVIPVEKFIGKKPNKPFSQTSIY